MAVTQLSVMIENSPGKAEDILGALAKAKVDIRAISVADTADHGVVRLIVNNPAKAKAVLKRKGLTVISAPVLAVVVHDAPGALAKLLEPLAKKNLNVEYLYGTTCACSNASCGCSEEGCDNVIVLRVKDARKAEAALKAAGHKTVRP